jgi:hypothetical protein
MTRKELLSQIENAKNNYVLGLASISLFSNEKSYPILDESVVQFGTYTIEFKQVKNLMITSGDREIAIREYLTSQIRAVIKESFELIKNYCSETNQTYLFHAETWYHFARMIRNCLSHNFKFEFTKFDKGLLPIAWKSKTIDSSFDGRDLKIEFFGYIETWELFSEFHNFANNKLS